MSMLGEVGEQVVAVHGQSDQLRLLRPAEQRAALDRFAGPEHEKLLDALARGVHAGGARSSDDLADRRRNARERNQEADLLRLGLDEITRVDPQPGEDDELRAEAQRLEHAEGLRTAAQIGAPVRRRWRRRPTDETPDAASAARHGPADPGGAGRRRPGARGAGRRGWRRRPRWSPTSSAELSALPGGAGRRSGPVAGGLRAAGGAARR